MARPRGGEYDQQPIERNIIANAYFLGCGLASGFFTGSGVLVGAISGAFFAFFDGLSTLLLSPILCSPSINTLYHDTA